MTGPEFPRLAPQTVGVIGSGTDAHEATAQPLGELLADLGVNLLTGGGGGVMAVVSRAFTRGSSRRGICIGIIPCASEADRSTPKAGYPNPHVELAIQTHLPLSGEWGTHDLSRNHINVLTSSALVALPGASGTASEVLLAIRYGKPIIAYAPDLALIAQVPPSVPRAVSLDEVRDFLSRRIRVRPR